MAAPPSRPLSQSPGWRRQEGGARGDVTDPRKTGRARLRIGHELPVIHPSEDGVVEDAGRRLQTECGRASGRFRLPRHSAGDSVPVHVGFPLRWVRFAGVPRCAGPAAPGRARFQLPMAFSYWGGKGNSLCLLHVPEPGGLRTRGRSSAPQDGPRGRRDGVHRGRRQASCGCVWEACRSLLLLLGQLIAHHHAPSKGYGPGGPPFPVGRPGIVQDHLGARCPLPPALFPSRPSIYEAPNLPKPDIP
jgi:hypothetical protein